MYQLDDGQYERAFGRYDEWIREDSATDIASLVDAASTLWRFELLGNDVFDRWLELLPAAQRHLGLHISPWWDAHLTVRWVVARLQVVTSRVADDPGGSWGGRPVARTLGLDAA
jgi:hypothetical protein